MRDGRDFDAAAPFDRRTLLKAGAVSAALLSPAATLAQGDDLAAIRKAVEAGHDQSVRRIQDWIRNPAIAAENLNMPAGAEYMARLAREAGFQHAEVVPTSGHPGVFATLDAGAPRMMGIYFM